MSVYIDREELTLRSCSAVRDGKRDCEDELLRGERKGEGIPCCPHLSVTAGLSMFEGATGQGREAARAQIVRSRRRAQCTGGEGTRGATRQRPSVTPPFRIPKQCSLQVATMFMQSCGYYEIGIRCNRCKEDARKCYMSEMN